MATVSSSRHLSKRLLLKRTNSNWIQRPCVVIYKFCASRSKLEKREGELFGFEYKWGKKRVRPPKSFLNIYLEATFDVVTPKNFLTHMGVGM